MRTMQRFTITMAVVTVVGLTTALAGAATVESPQEDDGDVAAAAEAQDPTDAFITRLTARPAAIAELAGEDQLVDVYLSRDPFQPVVPIDDGEALPEGGDGLGEGDDGGSSDGGSSDGGSGDGGSSDGGDGGSGGSTTGGADDGRECTGSQSETVCDGTVVTPVTVGQDTAVVEVDGVSYEVGVGEVFAGSFGVVDLDPPCVSLVYGDEGFSVCEGSSVLK